MYELMVIPGSLPTGWGLSWEVAAYVGPAARVGLAALVSGLALRGMLHRLHRSRRRGPGAAVRVAGRRVGQGT